MLVFKRIMLNRAISPRETYPIPPFSTRAAPCKNCTLPAAQGSFCANIITLSLTTARGYPPSLKQWRESGNFSILRSIDGNVSQSTETEKRLEKQTVSSLEREREGNTGSRASLPPKDPSIYHHHSGSGIDYRLVPATVSPKHLFTLVVKRDFSLEDEVP